MTERPIMVKMTTTRSGSEHLSASGNKHGDYEVAEKKQKLLFQYLSVAMSGQS